MVEIIEGKGVGSGKSYFVIDRLLPLWAAGGTAYVSDSFQVRWEECKKYAEKYKGLILEDDQFREVPADQIARVHEHTAPGTEDNPVLIVIDEAQDIFDVRDFSNKSKNDVFAWACQSRHDDNDLLFVTQNAKNIDARIRRIATYIWSVRNSKYHATQGIGNTQRAIQLATLGLNNGHYFIRTQLDYDGRTIMQKIWRKVDKNLFKCYRSKAMGLKRSRGGERVGKKQLQKVKGRSTMIKYIILIGVAVVAFCAFKLVTGGGLFGATGKKLEQKVSTQRIEANAEPTVKREKVSAAPAYTVQEEKWLAKGPGYIKLESGMYERGKMSGKGFVQDIQGGVVRLATPDGGLVYIVGKDYATPVVETKPTPAPEKREIVVAPVTPQLALTTGKEKS